MMGRLWQAIKQVLKRLLIFYLIVLAVVLLLYQLMPIKEPGEWMLLGMVVMIILVIIGSVTTKP